MLLGFGMQLLHELPVLDREAIVGSLPNELAASHLARQVEQLKVTPEGMNMEELSKLWSALQAKYRPTVAYQVSVVLIEAEAAARSTLPVLERRIATATDLAPPLPAITAVRPPNDQPGAELTDTVVIEGHHLDGSSHVVVLENRVLELERVISATGTPGEVSFTVPNQPAALAVGTHALRVQLTRPGESAPRETNQLALTIVPRITTGLPLNVARDAQGTATIALNVRPQVRPHQRASLILAGLEAPSEPHAAATASLTFKVADAPVGTHLVRVRVDGIDSLIIDRGLTPASFLDRRVVIA